MILEICCDSCRGVESAVAGGADRVELCSSLSEGGTTPSVGACRVALQHTPRVVALIRPRPGDFCYTQQEVEEMAWDIEALRRVGITSFAIGALVGDRVDEKTVTRLIGAAPDAFFCFHRAVDELASVDAARLKALGIGRVLSSGRASCAVDGVEFLAALQEKCSRHGLELCVAGKVSAANVELLAARTKAKQFHAASSVRQGFVSSVAKKKATAFPADVPEVSKALVADLVQNMVR